MINKNKSFTLNHSADKQQSQDSDSGFATPEHIMVPRHMVRLYVFGK